MTSARSSQARRTGLVEKLTGDAYPEYWRRRAQLGLTAIAPKGFTVDQTVAQGNTLWSMIEPALPPPAEVRIAVDFGCGWGRLTEKLRGRYPDADVWGLDFQPDMIRLARQRRLTHISRPWLEPRGTLFYQEGSQVPGAIEGLVDLVLTCAVLHHITDLQMWRRATTSFHRAVRPDGWLVMLESIRDSAAVHMTGLGLEAYKQALPGFEFEQRGQQDQRDTGPWLMVARRRPA